MSARDQLEMGYEAAQAVESGIRFLSWSLTQMSDLALDGKPVSGQVLADASDVASLIAEHTDYARDRVAEGLSDLREKRRDTA